MTMARAIRHPDTAPVCADAAPRARAVIRQKLRPAGLALGVAAALAAATSATAQDLEMPPVAYDVVAQMSYAMTADAKCTGITTRPKKMQAYAVSMYSQLGKLGISPLDAARHFETDVASAQIAARANAFRAKHAAKPDNDADFCRAVRAEAATNDALAVLMRLR